MIKHLLTITFYTVWLPLSCTDNQAQLLKLLHSIPPSSPTYAAITILPPVPVVQPTTIDHSLQTDQDDQRTHRIRRCSLGACCCCFLCSTLIIWAVSILWQNYGKNFVAQ